jgi:thiosulfate reductase cytochrome b subunit
MIDRLEVAEAAPVVGHAAWVRISHALLSASLLLLAFTGFVILMAHPRLYWGEAGNDLTPPLFELKISPNFSHDRWTAATPFFDRAGGPMTANRNYEPFNQNGWGRSLHFLAAWFLVVPGLIYLLAGLTSGHFRAHIWPRRGELAAGAVWADVVDHLRLRIRPASGGPRYGVLQKGSYAVVIFVAAPLMVLTGLAMAPAVTAAYPALSRAFGGFQSARTIHFFSFVALLLFVAVHVAMVIKSGFARQIKGMTVGE